jgi:exopolysaccharide biosynthesis polyprenyl glycosylphosphotransferase
MKRSKLSIKNLLIIALTVGVCGLFITSAWATLSFVQPNDISGQQIEQSQISEIHSKMMTKTSKARAPEPATVALFGGGFLGMIIGFVRRTYAFAKRTFDISASAVGLVLLSPLMLLTAVLVKLTSKGTVLYSQTRVGKDGHHFEIYKFRTMKADAEKDTGPVWAAENDNRLTPIGDLLRKTHMDELPQFFNVFRGEMSIIGPRPERPVFVNQFKEIIPEYERRLTVKPGITGLAQVWHRYDETIEDVKKKLKYDLLYIRKLCFWADLMIAIRTFRVIFTGEGAR